MSANLRGRRWRSFGGLWIAAAAILIAAPMRANAAAAAEDEQVAPADDREPGDFGGGRRGRGEGPSRRDALRLWLSLSEEERAEIRKMMAEEFPDRFQEVLELEDSAPDLFGRHLGRMLPEIMRLRELKQNDPEAFEARVKEKRAEFRLRRLARQYQFAEDADRDRLETEIRKLVEELFDLRQKRAQSEIHHLEQRLDQLARRMEERENKRDQLVERQMQDILAGRLPPPAEEDEGPPFRGRGRGRGRMDQGASDSEPPVSAVPEPESE